MSEGLTTINHRHGNVWLRGFVAVVLMLSIVLIAGGTPSEAEAQVSVELVPITGGLDSPVQVTNAGDGSDRLFVVERAGVIRIVEDGQLLDEPFLDLTDRVHSDDGEQGLLSLAFHSDYESNGEFFVFYTADDWANTVERFTVSDDPNRADRESGSVILALPDAGSHREHHGKRGGGGGKTHQQLLQARGPTLHAAVVGRGHTRGS